MIRILSILYALLAPITALAVQKIQLLEPLPGTAAISLGTGPLEVLNQYLRPFMPVLIGAAAGLAVLMIIYGGLEIMLSGGNIAQSKGKDRILASLGGLLLLVFSATVLYMLNANYFVLG